MQQVYPKGRRDPYFAYLAASEDGTVPSMSGKVADGIGFTYGSHFCHIKYDFGGSRQAIARMLFQALNHVLFNPVLPYDLYTIKKEAVLMQGTAQRLARRIASANNPSASLDKSFSRQPVV